MNVKRFTAKTSRDALALVRQQFGDDAVVMSTRPCAEGVEVLAMAPESVKQLEKVGAAAPQVAAPRAPAAATALPTPRGLSRLLRSRVEPSLGNAEAGESRFAESRFGDSRFAEPAFGESRFAESRFGGSVDADVDALSMSTLSFQDYVRERMLKRRQAELTSAPAQPPQPPKPSVASIEAARTRQQQQAQRREPPVLREEMAAQAQAAAPVAPVVPPAMPAAPAAPRRDNTELLQQELRSMRGLIEQRFGALAFMEKLQRHPRHAALTQKMLDAGFSPAMARKLAESLPAEGDEIAWAAGILERNLPTGEREAPLEDQGGVYALIGSTGVGKTTSTAKLAAAFATKHGAANLGLVTLDAYRVGAHEQLRTYGRILGVPVHTAHDRASLEDLLELLSGKKMVLIDTAGMAQRDSRTRELLEMLSHRSIRKLLVVNASAQGETIDDVLVAYQAQQCRGVILSKIDEAVKLAPALDAMIRHKLKVLAVGNGQRVPEDWHRLSAATLVQRALKAVAHPVWRMDSADMNLLFAGNAGAMAAAAAAARA
ncbi:MAG: flagellar biosynthesis protein FlhF [Rubrivivax sp.]